MQRCSIHEGPAKGEFKPAGAIAAGETRPGSIPRRHPTRAFYSTRPKPFYLKEGWLEPQFDESASTVELS